MASCSVGVADCIIENAAGCADYNDAYSNQQGNDLLLYPAFIIMAIMAFYIGANDVANAFGTSVGSKAINVRNACLLSGFADWLGAVSLGYGVSTTVGTGVAKLDDPECWACGYCDSLIDVYAVGMFGALIGAAFFLGLATFTRMPVSTTHSIIGAVVGVTIAGVGGGCLSWSFTGLTGIIASWVISPVLSGIIGSITYLVTDYLIVSSKSPLRNAMISLPALFFLVTLSIVYLILLKSKPTKKMSKLNMLWISLGASVLIGIVAQLALVPYVNKNLPSKVGDNALLDHPMNETSKAGAADGDAYRTVETPGAQNSGDPADVTTDRMSVVSAADAEFWKEHNSMTTEQKDVLFVFRYLIVMTATLESYAHGSNDTANATGPLSTLFNTWDKGLDSCKNRETPIWIMAIAGFFVFIGINVQGYRVMETIGKRISTVNMHRGFCMEFASAVTVIIATMLKLPVSTTHCQVGAVFFVSWTALGYKNVSFPMMGKIVLSWVVTLPFAGLVGGIFTIIFRATIKN